MSSKEISFLKTQLERAIFIDGFILGSGVTMILLVIGGIALFVLGVF